MHDRFLRPYGAYGTYTRRIVDGFRLRLHPSLPNLRRSAAARATGVMRGIP
jgi:hypothetical protein